MTARVGLIIPSSNRMVEDEMVHAFPAGVRPHVTRLRMTGEKATIAIGAVVALMGVTVIAAIPILSERRRNRRRRRGGTGSRTLHRDRRS